MIICCYYSSINIFFILLNIFDYAGFGPMTAKLFAETMNLKNHVRTFPIVDYKKPPSSNEVSKTEEENKQNFRIYKQLRSKTRQTDISDFFQ